MRLALVSPFPPAKSGIADYAAALAGALRDLGDVTPVSERPASFRPESYDAIYYQLGNNAWHVFVYELALEHPGIVVLHEANLHHLIADLTIRRGDWDGYLAACEYDGGPAALAFAREVRQLKTGPDYEGVPMLRRVLDRARGVIVHSRYCEAAVRAAGFSGPTAVIPHGAWLPEASAMPWRHRLGLDERTPLVGIFGFLKPYKRIAQSLRALRRLLPFHPNAKMILVGEVHPELPLRDMLRGLGLEDAVRLLGFADEEEFTGCMAACDAILNLRYPTVGESSGTLLRAFGLGKPTIVSDVGSFAEYPDTVCLKAPVDAREEDTLFEYLNLLMGNRSLASALGASAREWAQTECSWPKVARQYVEFAQELKGGRPPQASPTPMTPAAPETASAPDLNIDSVLSWTRDGDARAYVEIHKDRLVRTLELTPPGSRDDHILEMGAYLQITPALHTKLGYGHVRGCYYGTLGQVDRRRVTSSEGEEFECDVDLFDAEKDRYPYEDGRYTTVICGELIEHLPNDPMHMMSEINRILKPGGHLVLTTPNIASLRAIAAILEGYHPGFFPAYLIPGGAGEARHNREYAPREMVQLFVCAGFEVVRMETGEFRRAPRPQHFWVEQVLARFRLPQDLRGDGIYVVGCKTGPVRERFPSFLYN